MRQREHEEARGAELRRQRGQAQEVGLELLEVIGIAHADEQPRARAADDAQRAACIDVAGGQGQRVEHGQAFAVVQLATQRRSRLTHRDAPRLAFAAHFHGHEAGLLLLPDTATFARQPGHTLARQHEMRGHRRMAHEARFGARCEEPHAQIVIGAVGLEHEGRVRVVELARNGEHFRIGERVGVEHHTGRIAREAIRGECVDLEYADAAAHAGREFYLQNSLTQATNSVTMRADLGVARCITHPA